LDVNNPEILSDEAYSYDVKVQEDPMEVTVLRKSTNETLFTITQIEFS